MNEPLRVPPAVELAFEKTANQVLALAKPDYDREPELRAELVGHLCERWREFTVSGMSTDNAEWRALEVFGSVEAVARAYRRPWLKRLLQDQRCRTERYLVMVVSNIVLGYFVRAHADFENTLFGNEANYLHPLIVIGIIYLFRWHPKSIAGKLFRYACFPLMVEFLIFTINQVYIPISCIWSNYVLKIFFKRRK